MAVEKNDALILIDASAILFRSYHALPPMTGPHGRSTQALFGFAKAIIKVLREFRPKKIAAVFDGKRSKEHRRKIYPEYKAQRKVVPEDLIWQIEMARAMCESLKLCQLYDECYEADDLIASYAHWAVSQGMKVLLCSQDKDLFQLLNEHVQMIYVPKDYMLMSAEDIAQKYGIESNQMVDWLALVGDSSDNIPGIPGIGPKTATSLIQDWGSLEGIYAHLGEIKSSSRRNQLIEHEKLAKMSYELIKLELNLPKEKTWEDLDFDYQHLSSWSQFCLEHGLKSIFHASQNVLEKQEKSHELKSSSAQEKGELDLFAKEPNEEKTSIQGLLQSCDFERKCNVLDIEKLKDECQRFSQWISQNEKLHSFYLFTHVKDFQRCPHIISLSFSFDEKMYCFLQEDKAIEALCTIIRFLKTHKERVQLIIHDAKPVFKLSQTYQLTEIDEVDVIDLSVGAYLLFTDVKKTSLLSLIHEFQLADLELLSLYEERTHRFIGAVQEDLFLDLHNSEEYSNFLCTTLLLIKHCDSFVKTALHKRGLWEVFVQIDNPLVSVIAKIENNGIYCDKRLLQTYTVQVRQRLAQLEREIFACAGEEFNINSPKQLAHILYEQLDLSPPKKNKTGFSTDAQVLEALTDAHPIAQLLLEYRFLEKLRSTYLESLGAHINPKSGRIHPVIDQKITTTGRLSCHDPNLQNIPIRTAEGKKVREAFCPQEADLCFLSADYSQIELRIMAHLSQDDYLLEAFARKEDIHRFTAAQVFNIPLEQVTSQQRSYAKAVNFGIIYGQQAFGLAKQLKIPVFEAREFIEVYFARYKGVRKYLDEMHDFAKKHGFTRTIVGRQRMIPELMSPKKQTQALGQRLAVNAPIQGSAADIIKMAMIQVQKKLDTQACRRAKMVLQIHDELLLEVPRKQVDEYTAWVKEVMESVISLRVPLEVNMKIGNNWQEC